MELLQLTYFCEAARCENFTRTAKKFSVPASDISQSVSRLEKELGKKLFDRRPNKIILNEYGRTFFEYVCPALLNIETAAKKLSDFDSDMKGELKLRICVCRSIVTGAIEKFRMAYPEMSFYISHGASADDDTDIIIDDDNFPQGGRCRHLLMEENILLAMEKGNPLSYEEVITGDMLKNERFITMPAGSSMFKITNDICAELGFEPKISIQSDDPFYIRKYVELGLGVAFFPENSWQGQFADNVALKKAGSFKRKTYAYCNDEKYISKASEVFLGMLKDAFNKRKEQ